MQGKDKRREMGQIASILRSGGGPGVTQVNYKYIEKRP